MASSGTRLPPTCRSRRSISRRASSSFCWRVEQLAGEGGFALVSGAPGTGKSVALRILAERLAAQRDVKVGVCSRPQANLADFYREMGDLFGVELRPHNRWAGAKVLRQRWQTHIEPFATTITGYQDGRGTDAVRPWTCWFVSQISSYCLSSWQRSDRALL